MFDSTSSGTSTTASRQGPRELLIVEGDSASKAVRALCDPSLQTVLAMQGKPLNACRASMQTIARNGLFVDLLAELGLPKFATASELEQLSAASCCDFESIVLLFDPDADGIHCEALMLMFFERVLPSLLAAGSIHAVRPPSHRFIIEKELPSSPNREQLSGDAATKISDAAGTGRGERERKATLFAYSEEQARRIVRELAAANYEYSRQYYRGLAGIDQDTLRAECVAPATRKIRQLTRQDAESAKRYFGGG